MNLCVPLCDLRASAFQFQLFSVSVFQRLPIHAPHLLRPDETRPRVPRHHQPGRCSGASMTAALVSRTNCSCLVPALQFQLFSFSTFQLLPKRGPKAMSGPQWRIWRCGWGDRPAERLSAGNPLPGTHLRFGLRFLIALRLRVGAGSGLPGRALFGLRIGLSHLVKHCKGFWRQYLIFVIPIVTHHPSPHVVRIDDRGWNTSNCKQYLIAGRAKNCDPHQSMIA